MGRVLPAAPPPERVPEWPRLSTVKSERLAFDCTACSRRGAYRVATLVAQFGDPALVDLPTLVALRGKCVHAVLPPRPGEVQSERHPCGVRLVP